MLSLLSLLATAKKQREEDKKNEAKVNEKVKEKQCEEGKEKLGKTQRRLQCKLATSMFKVRFASLFFHIIFFPSLPCPPPAPAQDDFLSFSIWRNGMDLRSPTSSYNAPAGEVLPSNLCKHFASNMIKLIVKTRTSGDRENDPKSRRRRSEGKADKADKAISGAACICVYV